MLRRFTANFAVFSMFVDFLLVAIALFASIRIMPLVHDHHEVFISLAGQPPYAVPGWAYVVFPAIWVLVLLIFSHYDGRRNLRLVDELANLTMASMFAAISLSGFLYLTSRSTARSLFLIFVVIAGSLLLLCRVLYRIAFHYHIINGVPSRRILIIGAGDTGREMEKRIADKQDLGLEFVGFLEEDPARREDPRVLGSFSDTCKIIREQQVNEVVLALPAWANDRVSTIVNELQNLPIKIWLIPDYISLAVNQARVEEVAGLPLIDLRAPALDDYQLLVKRIFDIVVTFCMSVVSLPLMAAVAVAIRFDSPGPVLFRQKRIGENGRPFDIYKFRSMVMDAEKQRVVIEQIDPQGRIIQDKNRPDPRITRVGRFIRRTSLDETPQFFNVLRGEMSMVGPRPELPHLVDQYEPWQRVRFTVPQGITGWWQVNGRSDKPMHLHTEEDLFYIRHYSIWLDIQILVMTFWTVISRRGAA